jgi:hypothetical protein
MLTKESDNQGAIMDIDKIVGQSLADKSAVGAINRPLRYCRSISLMDIIGPLLAENDFSQPRPGIILTDGLNEGKPHARAWSSLASRRISRASHLCAHPDRPFARRGVTSDPRVFPVLVGKIYHRRWAAINRPEILRFPFASLRASAHSE